MNIGTTEYRHGGDIYTNPGFLDFSANINLLGAPKSVIAAGKEAMDRSIHYPEPGSRRLCKAVAELEGVKQEQVLCGNGAAEILYSLVLAEKPKKALIPVPAFQEYEQALRTVDCQIEFTALGQDHLAEKIDKDTDMVFFCNPNNPTGILYPKEEMKMLLEKCRSTKTRLVVDECFMEFVKSPEGSSLKTELDACPRLFLLKAFTKIFGIPGLRLGYGLSSDKKLLETMRQMTQPWNVSLPAQEAGIAAAGERGFIIRSRVVLEEEKQYLLKELKQFPVKIYGHAANFIFFQSYEGLDQELKAHHILIRSCENFRGLSKGWYRIAVRTRRENEVLIQALKEIARREGIWQSPL